MTDHSCHFYWQDLEDLFGKGEPIRQAQQCRFRPGGTYAARELLHHDMESMSHVCTLEYNETLFNQKFGERYMYVVEWKFGGLATRTV